MEKSCKNKRLLKQYKMELNRYSINGAKVGIENQEFTKAASTYSKTNPSWVVNDPVIEKQFKYNFPS